MPQLNKIYTKTGDAGKSALCNGERRAKTDARFAVTGDIDEANACLGLCAAALVAAQAQEKDNASVLILHDLVGRLQQELFTLGCDMATPMDTEILRVPELWITQLEHDMDEMQKELTPLQNFILPGGNSYASCLHLARCVTRRCERSAWALHQVETCNEAALTYLNRLSDLLFVAARLANRGHDVLWQVPGKELAGDPGADVNNGPENETAD
ncbi:MAG: cob(I)yrinic acid a,c-diamide adenosyltransferase [Planctomycetes bacterium]|nr:cob(I)yrinic acid a,c-diamide adenosyltransferase [Planctomycetota bacterium]